MLKITATSLTTLAFLLGGGPFLAQAQQTASPPPHSASIPEEQAPAVERAQSKDTMQEGTTTAPAAPVAGSGPGWVPPAGLVQIKTTEQGIRYVSGGASQDEREEIRAVSNQFNLELLFAVQGGGEYLADVQVRVLDSNGAAVLSATSKGPYFLAQLPQGKYTVEASAQDQSQKKTTQIGSGKSKLDFYWR